jgi:acyl carrier protein
MQTIARTEIEDRIKHILISQLDILPGVFAGGGSTTPLLGRGIGLDSMETLTLVAAIEEEFDIQVDDADLTVGLFKNIAILAEYVLKKTSEQNGLSTDSL